MVKMFRVDIGDNADGRRQAHKCAVAFIGLNHHPFALSEPRIRAISINDAAINHGRVKPGCIKHGSGQ